MMNYEYLKLAAEEATKYNLAIEEAKSLLATKGVRLRQSIKEYNYILWKLLPELEKLGFVPKPENHHSYHEFLLKTATQWVAVEIGFNILMDGNYSHPQLVIHYKAERLAISLRGRNDEDFNPRKIVDIIKLYL